MLIFDRGSVFGKVIRQDDKDAGNADETDSQDGGLPESDGADGDVLKQADAFIENLTDARQAKVSYQEIISEANRAVEHMIYENASSHIDVKAAKALYKGLALAGNLAKEENYEIPMDIDGEITSVNLKIYHNASKTGKVAVTFDTEKFGKVAAEFDVTEKRISGMVVYENRAGKADLEQLEQAVTRELGRTGDKQVGISLVQTKSVDLNKFGQDRDIGNSKDTKVPTGELYRTAKAFLTALKKEK